MNIINDIPIKKFFVNFENINTLYSMLAKQKVQKLIQKTIENYAQKLESGKQIIRATIAEIVDFRIEFTEKDAESKKVLDFFEQIKPEEYIRRLTNSERKII